MSRDYGSINSTKRDAVLKLLSDLQWHPHQQLAGVGGVRYGARVLELRRLGYRIEVMDTEPQGRTYRLHSMSRGTPQAKKVKIYLHEDDAAALAMGHATSRAVDAAREALATFRTNKHKL